jgi:hypothetical protein
MEINFRDGFIEFYTPLTANATKKHPEQNRSMHNDGRALFARRRR